MLSLSIHDSSTTPSPPPPPPPPPPHSSQNSLAAVLKALMFEFPTRRHPQRPARLFVKTQGFEKRFFVQHFKKYFGDDVVWSEGTDMKTGDEGFEIQSPLQHDVKVVLVARMRQDAQKEYQAILDRRIHHRNTLGMVDRSPHIAASSCPHLDLFPSLEQLDQASEEISARLYAAPVRQHRHSHSTPALPTTGFSGPLPSPPPPSVHTPPPPPSAQQQKWRHSSFYAPSAAQHQPHNVPELHISHAPSQYGHAARRPSLRLARSADSLDVIGGGLLLPAPSDYIPFSPVEY